MTAKIRLSIFMALVSVVITYWPVPAHGRTFGERDEPNQTETPVQVCHNRLVRKMRDVCRSGGFHTPEAENRQTNNRMRRSGFNMVDSDLLDYIPRRLPRSIVDKCCKRSCSLPEMLQYCGSPRSVTLPSVTEPPPTPPINSDETQRDTLDDLQLWNSNGHTGSRNPDQRGQLNDSENNDLSLGDEWNQSSINAQEPYPSSVQMITEEPFPEPVPLPTGLND